MDEPALEPWQWPEQRWRKVVNHVRAGRRLHPAHWKDNARCAVALSFDSDHETNELRDGGKSIGRLSWGQYGNRVGVPRILEALRRHDVRASFYVPAVTALLYPDEQRQVVGDGRSGAPGGRRSGHRTSGRKPPARDTTGAPTVEHTMSIGRGRPRPNVI